MPNSTILTPEAKKAALAEKRNVIEGHKEAVGEAKKSHKEATEDLARVQDAIDSHSRTIEKLNDKIAKLEAEYEELKAAEVVPPRVSKNGKPLGRPRLTAEEKERRRAERAAATSASGEAGQVAVPADLRPLIPSEPSVA